MNTPIARIIACKRQTTKEIFQFSITETIKTDHSNHTSSFAPFQLYMRKLKKGKSNGQFLRGSQPSILRHTPTYPFTEHAPLLKIFVSPTFFSIPSLFETFYTVPPSHTTIVIPPSSSNTQTSPACYITSFNLLNNILGKLSPLAFFSILLKHQTDY